MTRSQTAMESVWSVSKLSTESVGSRRELVRIVFTPPTPTRLNSTVASRRRRRCVLGLIRSVRFAGGKVERGLAGFKV